MSTRTLKSALSASALAVSCAAAPRPNVVVMLADDLGWNAVGFHGDWIETPHIDSLAHDGIELDSFYVAPMCSPTRSGLMTGRYPIRFGMARAVIPPQRDFGLPVVERTLADGLATAGYEKRGIFGKWHLGHHRAEWHPLARGFTHFEGHYNGAIDYFALTRDGERDWHVGREPSDRKGYSTDLIADAACGFIRDAAAGDAPYFCYVPFNAPHSPFQAKREDVERFAGGRKATQKDRYKAMVWSLDQAVGRILQTIDGTGGAENTQVWFISDNGGVAKFKANNRPLRGHKLTTFEGGVRVVACVRWPAAWPGGRKVTETMGYIDLLPTILTAAGVDPRAGVVPGRDLDGIDVGPLLAGRADALPEREWYSYHGQPGPERETIAVMTPEWKLAVLGPDIRRDGITDAHSVHLFRLPEDPLEKNDLSGRHPEVVRRLLAKLVAHRSLQPDASVPPYHVGRDGFKPWKDWRIPEP